MSHHIDGHIHLFIELALGEFLRQSDGQHICLEDVLAVQLEDNLVAALGVVGMHVVLFHQVPLQLVY